MSRRLTPEILDTLPAAHPGAQASRRDLRLLNRLMGNPGWFHRVLRRALRPGDRVLELGAGDANLAALAPPGVQWDALDRDARPPAWAGHTWHQADLREFTGWANYRVLVGNLIFHHLSDDELAQLGAACRPHVRLILACEPHRSRPAALAFQALCPLIRAHPITRHDGRVSIEAGFRDDELARRLGLGREDWQWRIRTPGRGVIRLMATRAAMFSPGHATTARAPARADGSTAR